MLTSETPAVFDETDRETFTVMYNDGADPVEMTYEYVKQPLSAHSKFFITTVNQLIRNSVQQFPASGKTSQIRPE